MRMLNIDTYLLCRKHFFGEHFELHKFEGAIKKGKSIDGYIKKGFIEVHNLKKRHDELVNSRKFNHKSPLNYTTNKKIGKVDPEKSLKDLRERCEACRALQKERGII